MPKCPSIENNAKTTHSEYEQRLGKITFQRVIDPMKLEVIFKRNVHMKLLHQRVFDKKVIVKGYSLYHVVNFYYSYSEFIPMQ